MTTIAVLVERLTRVLIVVLALTITFGPAAAYIAFKIWGDRR